MKTRAIVFALRKHTDRSLHLILYTHACGRVDAYLFRPGSKSQLALYAPMNELELVLSDNPNKPYSVLEATLISAVSASPENQFIALTLSDVLLHTLCEPMSDEAVYRLLASTSSELVAEANSKKIVPTFLSALSIALGYGGQPLEEWMQLSSLAMYDSLIY